MVGDEFVELIGLAVDLDNFVLFPRGHPHPPQLAGHRGSALAIRCYAQSTVAPTDVETNDKTGTASGPAGIYCCTKVALTAV